MKHWFWVGCLLLTGCSSSYTVSLTSPNARLAELRREAPRRARLLQLRDQRYFAIAALQITPDTLYWRSPSTGQWLQRPTNEVEAIILFDRKTRVHIGGAVGFLAGGIAGAAVPFLAEDACGAPSESSGAVIDFGAMPCRDMATVTGIVGGLGGGLLGMVFGAIVPRQQVYRLAPAAPDSTDVAPVTPHGR